MKLNISLSEAEIIELKKQTRSEPRQWGETIAFANNLQRAIQAKLQAQLTQSQGWLHSWGDGYTVVSRTKMRTHISDDPSIAVTSIPLFAIELETDEHNASCCTRG